MSNKIQHFNLLAKELNISPKQVSDTFQLLETGATIPFIARYRKELTGSLDELLIAAIRDRMSQLDELDKRRKVIFVSIKEQDRLTAELEKKINEATTLSELEDLYLPYRPKRKTKASIAKEKGLEPLAKMIILQEVSDINQKASSFINKGKEVESLEEALHGARDIIAEWVNENSYARKRIRSLYEKEAVLSSGVVKNKEEEGVKYKNYFDWDEPLCKSPSHRVLAMFRGEKEGFLKLNITPEKDDMINVLNKIFIKNKNECSEQVSVAIKDAQKRLLSPSIETEIRQHYKEIADSTAISVFTSNLRQLLMESPLGKVNILAIDPGFRTGCKVVCLDSSGQLKHNETIFPHPPQNKTKQAVSKIQGLVSAYDIEAIAIGNGTAGRETEAMIKKARFPKDIMALMVNENGASVYSASKIARDEFPDYDITVRGAVSIGRRLMDPLAELVKIEPKSIGVGQYQHDVDQKALQQSLEDVVVSCVNMVGVNLNTSSKELLTYVSGIGSSLAKNITNYKNENGSFKSRKELLKVSGLGKKAFEQSAGFLRIDDAKNPLDNTAVHPESYSVIIKIAKSLKCSIDDLIGNEKLISKINLNEFITKDIGLPTLEDIITELKKPGRDPRSSFEMFTFDRNIQKMDDIVVGKKYPGVITNITAFGAFVDIGVHQDGLIHISQLADEFVSDPNQIVSLNQKVIVKVLNVEIDRKRIELSLKKD